MTDNTDHDHTEIEILPIIEKDDPLPDQWKDLHPVLPKPPFVLVLNAGVASGKSTTLVNMLYRPEIYRGKFDSVIVISPTIYNDPAWREVRDSDESLTIFSGDDVQQTDDILRAIYSMRVQQVNESEREGKKKEQTLIVLDDCLGYFGKGFDQIVSRHRHPGISFIVTTQDFRSIPKICRNNASHYAIFRTQNDKELGKIVEEFASNYGTKNFMDCYRECTADRYSFMLLHQRTRKIYKSLGKLVYEEK